MMYKEQQIFKE